MLFPAKNDSLLENILPVIEHPVKNKETVKIQGYFWKYGWAYLTFNDSSMIDAKGNENNRVYVIKEEYAFYRTFIFINPIVKLDKQLKYGKSGSI